MPIPLCLTALPTLPDGVTVPQYDRSDLSPGILHVGVGNFHRAHLAVYLDQLFSSGKGLDWAIIGAGTRSADIVMRDRLQKQDWLTTVMELAPAGLSARVTGSMIDFLPIDPKATIAAMTDPAICIVSLTLTEGGYFDDALNGGFDAAHPDILADVKNPENPRTVFGMISLALKRRRAAGTPPFTVLSCDNLPGNGEVAQRCVIGLAALFDVTLADWIGENVAFPNSMVDCITPATTERERALVRDVFGITDMAPVACEPYRQWVIEDHFPEGRPPFELVGVGFVKDVSGYELMKLKILNAGHAAIAYAAALLGHHFVHDAMADDTIRDWLEALHLRETIPTLAPIEGVDYVDYLGSVIERFSNPKIGDTIPRLAADGSDRQPKFILPTLRDALSNDLPIDGLALEVALWARYCFGESEQGESIPLHDSQSKTLQEYAITAKDNPVVFLENSAVFGALSKEPRFGQAFEKWLLQLYSEGTRATLRTYVSES